MTIKLTIAERVQDEMQRQNLTIAQLVKKTGMSQSTISEILIGKRTNLQSENLIKLSKGLNVSTDYLLGLTETWTTNDDYKEVYKEIGLNEVSIENIKRMYYFFDLEIKKLNDHDDYSAKISKEMKEFCISTLNELLSYYDLRDLLLDIYKFLSIKESWCDFEKYYDSASHSITLTRKQLEKVHLLLINEHFENIKKAKKQ